MGPMLLAGEVAWYVTGRFYAAADGSVRDAGYFLHLQGIEGGLFEGGLFGGEAGEGTARLTFLAEPFTPTPMANGGLALGLDPVGEFAVFLNRHGGATFDDPASFGRGEEVGRFRRVSVVMGTTVGGGTGEGALLSLNVFSARLVGSRPFELGGRWYDLRALMPHGVTQWGTAAGTAVGEVAGFTSVVPFSASAIAVGGGAGEGRGAGG